MFATYFGQAQLSGIVQMIGFIPMLFFMPFIKKLVNKYGKKEAASYGAFASMLGSVLMFIFPLIPNKTIALVIYMISLSVFGIGMGIYTCVSWAFMADAIDYNEWKFGTREEGTVYSIHSFFRKLAQGIGPSIVLLVMGALGYVSELGTEGQSLQTATNMCWLVAGLYCFSGIVMWVAIRYIYNLDKATLEQMTRELAERKAVSAKVNEVSGKEAFTAAVSTMDGVLSSQERSELEAIDSTENKE
jgi:GPH family glycoside/pentoside/hexuronide:cation symporter